MKQPQRNVVCLDCKLTFLFMGRGGCKRCPACRKIWASVRSYNHSVKTGKVKHPGVGSGGAQLGANNHTWKGGVAAYRKIARQRGLVCELCGKTDSSSRMCAHHLNHDRTMNGPENLVMVCKACHQNVAHPSSRNESGQYTSRKQIAEKTGELLEQDNPT